MRPGPCFFALLLWGCASETLPPRTDLPDRHFVPFVTTDSAPVPTGYGDYCRRYADRDEGCVVLTPDAWRGLNETNARINAAIRPATDVMAFGVPDFWEPLEAGGEGDCEDYALAKLHRLMAAGWPRQALRLAMVEMDLGAGASVWHVVLTVHTDRGVFVLDNMTDLIHPWHEAPYRWESVEMPGSGRWLRIAGATRA